MSRTTRGMKWPGYDYWKRRMRYSTMCGFGPIVKQHTSRLHRRIARNEIASANYAAVETLNARCRGMTPT